MLQYLLEGVYRPAFSVTARGGIIPTDVSADIFPVFEVTPGAGVVTGTLRNNNTVIGNAKASPSDSRLILA